MTHRDDLLAMRARLQALEHEIDDVRAENDLLRDAHTQRALEAETLRRALAAARAAPDDARFEHEPERDDGEPWPEDDLASSELPAEAGARRLDRALPAAALAAGLVLMGTMTLAGLGTLRLARARAVAPPPLSLVTPLSRPGSVLSAEGVPGLRPGDACMVRREPVQAGRFDCRVVVECGGHLLYGADENSGYAQCGGREWVQDPDVTADDGDPRMILDVALDVVTVEDRAGLDPWRVRIRI